MTAVLRLLPIVAFGLIYPGWVTYQAGEVRKSQSLKAQLFAIVGGKVAGVVFALFFLPLPIHHVGEELFGASAHVAVKDPASFWVLAPRLFATNQSPWPGIITIASLAVLINVWFWLWAPNHVLAASRVLLAMCWDRVLPAWLGRLDARTGTPRRAILVFSVLSLAACLLTLAGGMSRLAILATILSLVTFAITCLAAALLPFAARELYRESPASRLELFHVPLISIAGSAFLTFAALLVWQYVRLGLQLQEPAPWTTTAVLGAIFLSCFVCSLLLGRRRRLEGSQVRVFYRQEARDAPLPTAARIEGDLGTANRY
jgi:amino acid transporter